MENKITTKLFGGLCVALIAITCAILCMGSSCIDPYSYEEAFKLNWKVVLPDNMEMLFSNSDSSWLGDGIRYAVFKLDEEPTEFIEDFNLESDSEMENKVNKYLDLAGFEIPEEFLPDWNEKYCWKLLKDHDTEEASDSCYLIYFNNLKRFSICEDFF